MKMQKSKYLEEFNEITEKIENLERQMEQIENELFAYKTKQQELEEMAMESDDF